MIHVYVEEKVLNTLCSSFEIDWISGGYEQKRKSNSCASKPIEQRIHEDGCHWSIRGGKQ